MRRLFKLIATGFYLGYSPLIPGTLGSLLALPICYLLRERFLLWTCLLLPLFLAGSWIATKAEVILGSSDDRRIVVDEMVGVFIVFWGIPFKWFWILPGLLLYRFFDCLKPFPIRRLEVLPRGWGVMADDLIAGVYVNLILQLTGFLTKSLW